MTLFLPTICLFGCTLNLVFEDKGLHQLSVKAKLLASLAFVGFAWEQGAWQNTYGQWIFVGLSLSLVGDVLLAFKNKRHCFLLGMGAFLFAHLVFAGAFLQSGFNIAQLPLLRLVIFAVLTLLIVTGLWLRPHLPRPYNSAVPAYLVAIGLMLVSAWGNQMDQAWVWIVSGATLFAVSDLFVARQRFVKPQRYNRIIGLPTYYVAQLLLAYSVTQV